MLKKVILPFFSFITICIILLFGFPAQSHAATYYSTGTVTSNNLFSGEGVSGINAFGYNATIPANTSIQVQFSWDGSTWYNSSGVGDGWDTLSNGDHLAEIDAIDISGLSWVGGYFYYRVQFNTTDTAATAVIDEIRMHVEEGASVSTVDPTYVQPTSVTANGEITALSGGNATRRGFQYGLTETATWEVHEDGDFGVGTYSLDITGLSANTTYYVRGYTVNPGGTSYGYWTSFTTGTYASSGEFTSSNILSGQSIKVINGFDYTLSAKPAGTEATVQFSPDGSTWYDSFRVQDGVETLSVGTNTIGLCNLHWKESSFYYKIQFTSNSTDITPVLDGVSVVTDDSENTCGPILDMNFDEGSGQAAYDSSGSENDGTLGLSTAVASDDPSWTNEGKFGKALSFDGTDDYVNIANTLSGIKGISIWVNPTTDTESIISFDGTTHYISASGGVISATGFDQPTIYVNGLESTALTAGEWNHIVVTTDTAFNGTNVDIGSVGADFFSGIIDAVQVFTFYFSDYQAKLLYNQDKQRVFGSTSTNALGETADFSSARSYCIPGDTATCDAPVAEWRFDENTGTSANDTSGNGNTGTLGGDGLGTDVPKWVQGKVGGALEFDGTDDYVEVGTGPTSVRAIAFWVYPQTITEPLINLTSTTHYLEASSGTIDLVGDAGESIYVNGTQSTTLTAGQWQHITVVTTVSENASNINIGRTQGTNYFNGLIDDVRIYDYARTPAQIAWDYNRGAAVGWWKFDECQGTVANDSSGNGNNGTITEGGSGSNDGGVGTCSSGAGNEMWDNGTTGERNGSLDFDGTDDYVDIGDISRTDIKGVSFWVKAADTTESIMELSATDSISVSSGTVSASGFGTESIYVDGRLTTSLPDTSWHYITVLSDANITANTVNIGKVGSTYFNGQIDEVKIFNYALTPAQIRTEMAGGAVRFE